jgi:crossover junction endodeoxyribonuclease RuvC
VKLASPDAPRPSYVAPVARARGNFDIATSRKYTLGWAFMRVLGIDPGSRFVGFGVVDGTGRSLSCVTHGVLRADTHATLSVRLHTLFGKIQDIIDRYAPDELAVEGVFFHKNARSALILGHARGVVLLAAAEAGLRVHEYAPARIKRAIGAGGNDSKMAVQRMVTLQLKLESEFGRSDASDALAIAMCHHHHTRGPSLAPSGTGSTAGARGFEGRLRPSIVRHS